MRERLQASSLSGRICRITPARAGKTSLLLFSKDRAQDHPRSCGKDSILSENVRIALGSPPLVRERHIPVFDGYVDTGITPARAGKTPLPD